MAALYDELRVLAAAQLRHERVDHTLQATALVNEAYVRLAGRPKLVIENRGEFFRLASSVMRNLLVDHARAHNAAKRGGDWQQLTLSAASDEGSALQVDVLALEEALTELSAVDERVGQLVELRFFGGLSESEAADMLGVSRSVATRDWRMARAWLAHRLRDSGTRT
jgi:RNA polymerase sigma factor (TIGR02999 family)